MLKYTKSPLFSRKHLPIHRFSVRKLQIKRGVQQEIGQPRRRIVSDVIGDECSAVGIAFEYVLMLPAFQEKREFDALVNEKYARRRLLRSRYQTLPPLRSQPMKRKL